MSWPTDGAPRFVVRALSGYRITATAYRMSARNVPITSFTVLDRADCYRLLAEFAPHQNGRPWEGSRRRAAERLAAQLNEEYA